MKVPAHKIILAARSPYFRALLYGGLAESTQNDIELKVPLEAFKTVLKYVYTGYMSLNQMNDEDILDSLGLAHQYGFKVLELAISGYLTSHVTQKNCCEILDAAQLYDLQKLSDVCMTFMDQNITELLASSSFKMLSQDSLCKLLERDSFFVQEIEIFNGVNEWYKHNPSANIEVLQSKSYNKITRKYKFNRNFLLSSQLVLSKVRFSLMDLEQLFALRSSSILDVNRLFDAIEDKTVSKNIRYRGTLSTQTEI